MIWKEEASFPLKPFHGSNTRMKETLHRTIKPLSNLCKNVGVNERTWKQNPPTTLLSPQTGKSWKTWGRRGKWPCSGWSNERVTTNRILLWRTKLVAEVRVECETAEEVLRKIVNDEAVWDEVMQGIPSSVTGEPDSIDESQPGATWRPAIKQQSLWCLKGCHHPPHIHVCKECQKRRKMISE